ncbi:MAG: 2-hydroxyacyl-CoA dehydratase [Sphingomonadales bacterium]|nr:MAG: 2-hydroxyacyl-CoA dehydratase [Sphingomonadales bacterium]
MTTNLLGQAVPDDLRAADRDRTMAGRLHYQNGGKVCGYFGTGMPIEIAMATGHMPMAIMPHPDRPTPHAEEWLNPTFDPTRRLVLDQLLSGELEFVDVAVAVSQASTDSHVFHTAREILRQGFGGVIPPLHHYSLLGLQSDAVREYGRMEIDSLARRLRANSGIEATDARLRDAIALTNAIRAQWRALNTLRLAGAVSGTDALQLMSPARFMEPEAYLESITRAVAGLGERKLTGPRLMVISSTPLSDTRVHEAIEAAGAIVIGEDDIWGARSATPDIEAGDDVIQSIYRHYYDHVPNRSVYPATVRLGWIYENMVLPEVDGVIVQMTRADRDLGWDYPRIRDFLTSNGKPHLMTREDAATDDGAAALTREVAAFINQIQE